MDNLILKMLDDEPKKRPRFSQIVSHLDKFPKERPDESEFFELFKEKTELDNEGHNYK